MPPVAVGITQHLHYIRSSPSSPLAPKSGLLLIGLVPLLTTRPTQAWPASPTLQSYHCKLHVLGLSCLPTPSSLRPCPCPSLTEDLRTLLPNLGRICPWVGLDLNLAYATPPGLDSGARDSAHNNPSWAVAAHTTRIHHRADSIHLDIATRSLLRLHIVRSIEQPVRK